VHETLTRICSGRTTSGMVVASLVSTILDLPKDWETAGDDQEDDADPYDLIDGFSDDQVYQNGTPR